MESLYQTIKEILDSGRVGVPVFVRCMVQIAPENGRIGEMLARISAMASSWLGSAPLKVYAQSKDGMRQLVVTIQYMDGKTAIISVNSANGVAIGFDLMLLGNKGCIYHDAEALAPGFDISAVPVPIPEWLFDAIGQSLQSGKPVVIKEVSYFE